IIVYHFVSLVHFFRGCPKVTQIEFDKTEFAYSGGTLTITVSGTYVQGNVEIMLEDTSSNQFYAVEDEDAEEDTDDAVFTAELPTNPSYNHELTYTVYYIVGNEAAECDTKITVAANTSVARITAFTYDGQVGDTKITETDDDRIISITMPYDHVYAATYTPKTIEYIGSSISPNVLLPVTVTQYSNYAGATYTVTAYDKVTTQDYLVRIYRDSTPVVKSISFQNPQTYEGGEVTVTLRGTALGNVKNAENENNRNVYIYSSDGTIAETLADYTTQSDTTVYSATITVPENESDSEAAEYTLMVKIGDTVQSVTATLKVPRRSKSNTGISEFTVENQVGETEFAHDDGNVINITMPYDADITDVYPSVTLSDIYSTYSPLGSQNFDKGDVVYTVTAEDGETTEEYTVHLEKQETPAVTSIDFTSEVSSGAGRIKVTLNGANLENAANSVSSSEGIVVSGVITTGGTEAEYPVTSGTASCDSDGNWTAYIVVPQNDDTINAKEYTLSVTVNGITQTLSGNTVLTVLRKLENSKELTSFTLLSDQVDCKIYSDNTVYVKVPYNTDLSELTPTLYHTGVSYVPTGAQDFNDCPITYTIYAEDGTYSNYDVYVERNGSAQISAVSIDSQPETFKDTEVSFDVTGSFISSDEIAAYVVLRGSSGTIVYADITRDTEVYGGHLTLTLNLPENTDTTAAKIYDLYINVNGTLQSFGLDGAITVPRRSSRTITSFEIEGQEDSAITEIDDTTGEITVTMPYDVGTVETEPSYTYDGDSVTVEGTLDFYNSATYTVSAADDTSRVYTVTLKRGGTPTIASVSVSDNPETYAGGEIEVEISGIFYDTVKVEAVDSDGNTAAQGTVEVTDGTATASLTLPQNENTVSREEYTLRFTVDGYEDVEYELEQEISVPRRTTRTITSFAVDGQLSSEIEETGDTTGEITVIMPYDVKAVTTSPTYTYDGDAVEVSGALDFYNNATYTVSAADDTSRVYTIILTRYGEPTIESVSVSDSPETYAGGNIKVDISGIFYDSAMVTATGSDGSTVSGEMTISDGTATVSLTLPENESTESAVEYTLSFNVDGAEDVEYDFTDEISVPRRTTREITAFSISAQEGDTVIDGTDITITVPYNTDMTSVEPEIEFDADSITPTGAQDFSDDNNPVTYTLSSADDEDVTYTVYVVKNGVAPQITSFTVDKQKEETVYGDDSIYILISSGSLKAITPEVVCTDGADYTPKGAQDFSKSKSEPVVYTVTNQYGVSKEYSVTIEKKSSNNSSAPTTSSSTLISFDADSIDAVVGDEFALTPTITGTTADPTYTTSDSDVAVVDSDGNVTVVGEGTALITASVSGVTASVTINAAAADDEKSTDNTGDENESYIIPNYVGAYISGYEDGTFRPNAYVTRAEIAAIAARICVDGDSDYEADYDDIPSGAWYAGYVGYLTANGIMNGYEDGTFRPNGDISRGELCAVVTRMINCELSDSEPAFDDIKDSWAAEYIMTLYDKGYITGYEDGTFRPNGSVTRAETVTIMNHLVADGTLVTNNVPTDVDDSFWAYDAIIKAMNTKVVSEDTEE
ncbi:MAG: S-layer homology domain-containing protein, partial [Firmicutes bacterium]|nr:S-layer homology domain-containing protein [Bacillota bacterium]